MPSPFEVPFAEVQANIDSFVEEVFASLQSGFMTLPKGFRDMTPEPVIAVVWQTPLILIVLRASLHSIGANLTGARRLPVVPERLAGAVREASRLRRPAAELARVPRAHLPRGREVSL